MTDINDLWEEPDDDDEEEEEELDRRSSPMMEEEPGAGHPPDDLLVSLDAEENEAEADQGDLNLYDTQHSDGHTYNVSLALDQGLTYTPPSDPPVLPSPDSPEGIEIAAGFALSMEDSDPDVEILPDSVDNNNLDLEEDVYEWIRMNSETQNLTDIEVRVADGVIALYGTVPSDEDLDLLLEVMEDMPGVVQVLNYLDVEDQDDGVME